MQKLFAGAESTCKVKPLLTDIPVKKRPALERSAGQHTLQSFLSTGRVNI